MAGQPGGQMLRSVWVDLGWPLGLSGIPSSVLLIQACLVALAPKVCLPEFHLFQVQLLLLRFSIINSGLPRLQYHIEGLLKRPTHAQTLPEDQVKALNL